MARSGWLVWVLALASVVALWNRGTSPALLRDTDTAVLLDTLRRTDDPWRWFASDWPLGNHFYRPVSTLTFELDRALWDGNAAGFALTNAALAFLSIVLLYAALRQLSESRPFAAAGATLFALWHSAAIPAAVPEALRLAVLAAAALALWRRRWIDALVGLGVGLWAVEALAPLASARSSVLQWIPGRTASSMAVFCLAAMACHGAFVRRFGHRERRAPGPFDPPATRNTEPDPGRDGWTWPAYAGSPACLALALGCYEQAVMLPAVLAGCTLALRWRGWRVAWWTHLAHWAILAAYLVVRARFVPMEASGYQEQQFRSGPGVWIALFDYALPTATLLWQGLRSLDLGWMVILGGILPSAIVQFALQAAALARAWTDRGPAAWGWALSLLAFLPMAWLKPFGHYHYWPMAIRAAFALGLWGLWWSFAVSATSRPAVQAPPRRDPAPGSLPRP
ncbi:MAG: hypothetical protein ACK41F_06360 [Fimbriimonadaceae bacterium]